MSIEAITWVLNDAPDLPSNLVATLLALANHADADGRGTAPSQKRLARYTRKKPRTIRDDLAALESRGLIRRGDQRRVASLPADRRPIVYDLAMERRAQPPAADAHSEPQAGPAAAEPVDNRAAAHRRPVGDRRSPTLPGGGLPPPAPNAANSTNIKREAVHRRRTILEEEVTPPAPDELTDAARLLLELDHPWSVGRRTAVALAPLVAAALTAGWKRPDLAAHLAANPGGVRSYTAVLRARLGDLPAPPRPRHVPHPPPRHRPPAWCGECSPKSRMIPSPVHAGKFVRCTRCHTAHPGSDRTEQARPGSSKAPPRGDRTTANASPWASRHAVFAG
ncbi:helix-turn-helix domain-containing protein [Catellatospora sichuanensis]|uniref:helix-turn-helix domain-containing protein n=1 Tax=Catellatospora sichuanensis TaxID=1969805 RepID=UPI0011820FA0|nr:helix-turn-helix domain-containing protein [Catellatospora sichuanensis]